MDDENKTPWLNTDFLSEVLQAKEGKSDVNVLRWKCEPAVPSGMNYLSEVFRVHVEYRAGKGERSTSLIVKVPLPLGHEGRKLCDSFRGFQREAMMYSEVLPKMSEMYPWPHAPKAFSSPSPDIIVIEDLKEQDYQLYPRGKFLDLKHCKKILTIIANFHAISISLHHKNPELVQIVGSDPRFTEETLELEAFWRSYLGKFASFKACEEFASKIQSKIEIFYPTVIEMFKPSRYLNVLTHDDLWLNNLLFKYDKSGNLVDAKLIDFQSPRYCSFAADLIVFWWTSVGVEVREHNQEELFELYRENLNNTLEELGYPERVYKAEFDGQIRRFSTYALRPVSEIFGPNHPLLPTVLRQMEAFGVFS